MSLSEQQRWELAEADVSEAMRCAVNVAQKIWGDDIRLMQMEDVMRMAELVMQARRLRK